MCLIGFDGVLIGILIGRWGVFHVFLVVFTNQLRAHLERSAASLRHFRLRTWYLHPNHCQTCLHHRAVNLSDDPDSWSSTVHAAWEDLFQPHQVIELFVIVNDPPRDEPPSRMYHADVVLVCDRNDLRAGLISIQGDAVAAFELAVLLPPAISGADILALDVLPTYIGGDCCSIFCNGEAIPATADPESTFNNGNLITIQCNRSLQFSKIVDSTSDDTSCLMSMPQIPQQAAPAAIDQPGVARHLEDDFIDEDSDEDLHESDFSMNEDDQALPWHVVAVFDTEAHSARGRVPFMPYEAFFRRVRALIGLRHHDVARIIQIKPPPADLESLKTVPLLILRHDDFQEGDHRRAALVDIEYHGTTHHTLVETDRFVTKLPHAIHRTNLLIWIRVDRYCAAAFDRCLVWCRGRLIPLQSPHLLHIEHGDYIRVAIPPPTQESLPTRFATRCAQAGLSPRQAQQRHQERGEDTDSLNSVLSAAQSAAGNALMQLSSAISHCTDSEPIEWATYAQPATSSSPFMDVPATCSTS